MLCCPFRLLAMAVSKELKKHSLSVSPRDVAAAILAKIPSNHEIIESLEIAGPGFVNVRLKREYVADKLTKLLIKVISSCINIKC